MRAGDPDDGFLIRHFRPGLLCFWGEISRRYGTDEKSDDCGCLIWRMRFMDDGDAVTLRTKDKALDVLFKENMFRKGDWN